MDKSKVLIYENKDLAKTINNELDNYVDALNEVVEKYPALELGGITEEVTELILSPLGGKTIETQYWNTLKAQLDKSGVTNKILRDTVLSGSKEPIEEFKAAHRKAQTLPLTYRDTLKYIVFDGSNFGLIKGYKEEVLERYAREYLTDKGEIMFFQAAKNLEKALSAFREELKKVEANYRISRTLGCLDSILKPTPNGDWVADPERAIYFRRYAVRNQSAAPSMKHTL
ncbi:hypothetical protein [Dyadobacter sp. 676]|uniref:Uncharacterized protein n=1 Tax=Dyadobacter sp. 676 TaxID=3088362 RepID=A0AAU8FS50_9BACT